MNKKDFLKNTLIKLHNATNECWFAIKQIADAFGDEDIKIIANQPWRKVDVSRTTELMPGVLVPGVVLEENFQMRHDMVRAIKNSLVYLDIKITDEKWPLFFGMLELCHTYTRLRTLIGQGHQVTITIATQTMEKMVRLRQKYVPQNDAVYVEREGEQKRLAAPLNMRDFYDCEL